MSILNRAGGIVAVSCFLLGSVAHAALEKELHEVDTSIGLANTAANTWKLETDPVMSPSAAPASIPEGETLSDFYPIAGVFDNTFDPTQFRLATDPPNDPSDALGLGYSVEGIAPFTVTSFEVMCLNSSQVNDGSYILVQATGNGLDDSVTDVGDPDQAYETGQVDDITFQLDASEKTPGNPLPVTYDQNFFQLNLVALNGNPVIVPDLYSASGGPDGSLTISDSDGNTDTTNGNNGTFVTSYVPEPGTVSLLALCGVGLVKRRARN